MSAEQNAKVERLANASLGHQAAALSWPIFNGRRCPAVAAARSHRKSPEKPMCSHVRGDVWASNSAGTAFLSPVCDAALLEGADHLGQRMALLAFVQARLAKLSELGQFQPIQPSVCQIQAVGIRKTRPPATWFNPGPTPRRSAGSARADLAQWSSDRIGETTVKQAGRLTDNK